MPGQYIKKRHEPCIIFLDDAFDGADAARLREGGFYGVETFPEHFQREDGRKEQSVKDPRILTFCNRKQWLLVTTDKDIILTHIEEVKKCPDLAILATAHNSQSDLDQWVEGLIKVRPRLEREFKKRKRPWFAQFNRQGVITTIREIEATHYTRRNRPLEK